jgi:hypothetical protein
MNAIESPMTSAQHKAWREKIQVKFGEYIDYNDGFLLLAKFLDSSPQKYYNAQTAITFLEVLEAALVEDGALLASIIKQKEGELDISSRTLTDINSQIIHETFLPKATYDKIAFIDDKIHYNLLRILEGPVYQWLNLFASYRLLKKGKKADGNNLYNCFQVIAGTELAFVEPLFDKAVRNAVAHGKVSYGDNDVTYYDISGEKTISYRETIALFDKLVDAANGLALGFQLFYIKHNVSINALGIELPHSIRVEELGLRCDSPRWKVMGCFETPVIGDRRQLTVFIKDSCLQYSRALYQGVITVAWAESLSPGYDRYTLNITGKYAMGGYAAFTGDILRDARVSEAPVGEYGRALEENLFFYISKFKLPSLIYKAINYFDILKVSMPLVLEDYRNKIGRGDILCKDIKWHSRATHIVIGDASVVVTCPQSDYMIFVRQNYKKIVNTVIRGLFSEIRWFSWRQLLPVHFLRIGVYDTELRLRNSRESGLGEHLVCMLTINLTGTIKDIDIMGGVPEQHGKCRIVWNGKWLRKAGKVTEEKVT